MAPVREAALSQLKASLAKGEPGQMVGLRVFVQDGGCSGFSYGMGLDENPARPDDEVAEFDGPPIYVDAFSAQYIEGAEIDYVDALMAGGCTVHNPQSSNTCGCCTSFHTADPSR